MSVLAIDAGTTGVTALVVTPQGKVAAKGYQEFAQHFPQPGWVEHAPEEIWQATLEATRAALDQVDASELRAVGITNQRETVLLWDRETLGSPRRAIVWQDRRTASICDRLRDEGHEERVTELTRLLTLVELYLTASTEDEKVPVTKELEGELEAFAQAQGARDFQAWVGTENYEMRVAPDLSWIDQKILDIVRSTPAKDA